MNLNGDGGVRLPFIFLLWDSATFQVLANIQYEHVIRDLIRTHTHIEAKLKLCKQL